MKAVLIIVGINLLYGALCFPLNGVERQNCILMSSEKEEEINTIVGKLGDFLNQLTEEHEDFDITLIKLNIEKHSDDEKEEKETVLQLSVNDCARNPDLDEGQELKGTYVEDLNDFDITNAERKNDKNKEVSQVSETGTNEYESIDNTGNDNSNINTNTNELYNMHTNSDIGAEHENTVEGPNAEKQINLNEDAHTKDYEETENSKYQPVDIEPQEANENTNNEQEVKIKDTVTSDQNIDLNNNDEDESDNQKIHKGYDHVESGEIDSSLENQEIDNNNENEFFKHLIQSANLILNSDGDENKVKETFEDIPDNQAELENGVQENKSTENVKSDIGSIHRIQDNELTDSKNDDNNTKYRKVRTANNKEDNVANNADGDKVIGKEKTPELMFLKLEDKGAKILKELEKKRGKKTPILVYVQANKGHKQYWFL